jgi:hypothetical protein
MQTTLSSVSQCCQEAEISAAELKRGPTKICAAEFSLNMPKKGRKGAELF